MTPLVYRIFLHKEPEGGFTVTVPSLPSCVTYGEEIPSENDVLEYTLTLNAYA